MSGRISRYRRQLCEAYRLREQFISEQPVLDEVVRTRQQRLAEALAQAWGHGGSNAE